MTTPSPAQPLIPPDWANQAIDRIPSLRESLRALRKERHPLSDHPSRLLGQTVGRFVAPKWLWILETDVFHRRMFSWNRLRYWDHPYARMLLDTRPSAWDALCQQCSEELSKTVDPLLTTTPSVDPRLFWEGVKESLLAVAVPALRTAASEPQEALHRWVEQSLVGVSSRPQAVGVDGRVGQAMVLG